MSIERKLTALKETDQPVIINSAENLRTKIKDGLIGIFKASFSDVAEFSPEEGVKILREKIAGFSLKPHSSEIRILFINSADAMNQEEANALLKVLEEPPHYGRIYLFARNTSKILPTIKSRSQKMFLSGDDAARESILPFFSSRDFNSFLNKLNQIDIGQTPDLIEAALEEMSLKGINEGNGDLYRKLVVALNLMSSTNINRRLILEQIYISLKNESH